MSRTCVACRNAHSPHDMIRVVRSPEGQVLVDEKGRQSGRGAYVCPTRECVLLSLKKRLLEKALKTAIPVEVASALCRLAGVENDMTPDSGYIRRELMSTLGLARKSGELIIGQDRVLQALSDSTEILVLLANDHSATLKRAIDAKSKHTAVLSDISRADLGVLFGMRQAQIVAIPIRRGLGGKVKGLLSEGGNAIE